MSSRILVVDDDPVVRDYAAATLRVAGFAVVEAASGEHALEILRVRSFDVLVLDKRMPGVDGTEVARQVRSLPNGAQVAVLMLSGLDSDSDQWEGWQAGVDVYVTKPFDGDELVAHVRRLIRLKAHAV